MDKHAPFSPGDVVRDRQTSKDYLIEAVVGSIAAGVAVYKLVGVLDDRLQEVWAKSEAELQEQFMTVVHNERHADPQVVLNQLREDFTNIVGQDTIIKAHLDQAENATLRDLVYVSREVEDDSFGRGLIDLAESLVRGGTRPNKAMVRQLLSDMAPANVNAEFLNDLTERINGQLVSASIRSGNARLMQPAEYQDLLQFAASEFSHAREAGLFATRQAMSELPKLSRTAQKVVTRVFGDRQFGTTSFGNWQELDQAEKGLDRAMIVYRELFKELTGKPMSRKLEAMLRKDFAYSRRMAELGRATPMTQLLVKRMNVESAKRLTDFVPTSKIQGLGLTGTLWRRAQQSERGAYSYLGGVISRTAGIKRPRHGTFFRPAVNWDYVARSQTVRQLGHSPDTISSMLSVDTSTFLNDLIGQRSFIMGHEPNSPIMNLANPRHLKALSETLSTGPHNTGSVLMDRDQLRRLLEQRANNQTLQLQDIIQQTGTIQQAMPSDIREKVRLSHYSGLGMATKDRVVDVQFNAGEMQHVLSPQRRLADSEAAMISKLLADPEEGKFRLWMVHHKQGAVFGSSNLPEMLQYMETNAEQLEHTGLHSADVAQIVEGVQQIFDVPRSRPLIEPGSRHDVRTVRGMLLAMKEQGMHHEQPRGLLTRTEVQSMAHAAQVNQKQELAQRVSQQRIAVGLIKNPAGDSETKILATNLNATTVERQTELVRRLYSEGGLIVDIETRPTRSGGWTLKELGWAENATSGQEFKFHLGDPGVIDQKIQAFIQLGKRMRQAPVVASHTDYDPRHLLEEAEIWKSAVSDRPALLKQLEDTIQTLQEVQQSKWLDLTVLHQMRTGETANQISQEYLALKFLQRGDRIEHHTALSDAQQAWKLAEQGRSQILSNLDHLQLMHGEQITKKDFFLMEASPRGMNYGRLLRVEDLTTPVEGGAVAQVREYVPHLVGGRWVFEKGVVAYEEHADSVHALAGMLAKKGVVTSPEQFGGEHSGVWEKALQEQAERELRDMLNVASLRPYPQHEKYTAALAQDLGPHGMVQYRARVEAKSRLNDIWSVAKDMREQYTTGLAADTATVRKPLLQDFLPQAVEKVFEGFEPLGTTQEGQQYYRGMVQHEALRMAQSPHYAEVFTKRTVWGQFEGSALGREMTSSLMGIDENPFRPMFLALHAQEMAMEKMGQSIPLKNYGHRLGGEVAGSRISFKLGDMEAGDIQRAAADFGSWGADMLLHLDHGRDQEAAHEFFSGMLGNERTAALRSSVTKIRTDLKIDQYNTEGWKAALLELSSNPETQEERLVADAMHELTHSSKGLYAAFQKLIADRQTNLLSVAQDEQSLAHGQSLVNHGTQLIKHMEAARQAGHTKIEDIFKLAMTEFKEQQGGEGLEFLADKGPDQAHFLRALAQLNPQDAATVIHRTDQLLGTLGEKLTQDDMMDTMVSETKGMWGVDRVKAMLEIARGQEGRAVRQAAEQASAARTIMQGPPTARIESEALHEYVNRANQAYKASNSRADWEVIHEMMLKAQPGEWMGAMRGPLMAAGGVIALMAAVRPSNDHFSQGEKQDRSSPFLPYAAKYAEIPGQSKIQRSWSGEPDAWQLDITFEGFVQSKQEQEELMRTVYDSMEGQVQVRKNHTQVADERDTNHRLASRELLRRSI